MDFAKYVKLRREKFGAVIFDTLNEKVYVTNESGNEILRLVADGLDVPAIARCLAERYDREPSEIQPDICEFTNELQAAGLLCSTMEGDR